MTLDDLSSIYVGGIPYDATEDTLRRVFDPYGDVVAVKIVNDRGTRGKCFSFVTFRNPRSAVNAIDDMDGRTIGGRVVRVNEMRTRGGRLGFEREGFQRGSESSKDWDRGRDRDGGRERDFDYDRERYRDLSGDSRFRDRHERSREYDLERERGLERVYDHNQQTDSLWDEDQDRDVDLEDSDREHSRNRNRIRERDHGLDSDSAREIGGNKRHRSMKMDKDRRSRKQNGSISTNGRGRELFSNSNNDNDEQLEEKLLSSTERLEELNKEISQTEEKLEESGILLAELQLKSKKLEELLINEKKTSSQLKTRLTKLHKCFLQVRDHAEGVKISEKELQCMVDGVLWTDIESLRGGFRA